MGSNCHEYGNKTLMSDFVRYVVIMGLNYIGVYQLPFQYSAEVFEKFLEVVLLFVYSCSR